MCGAYNMVATPPAFRPLMCEENKRKERFVLKSKRWSADKLPLVSWREMAPGMLPLIEDLMILSTMLNFANLFFFLWWKNVIAFQEVNFVSANFVRLQSANS